MTRAVCLGSLLVSLLAACGCGTTKQAYVAKGNKLFAAGKYREAELNYRAAIQKDAGYGEAYYRLGLAAINWSRAGRLTMRCFEQFNCCPRTPRRGRSSPMSASASIWRTPNIRSVLYTQIGNLADEFLSKNRNSYEGLMLKGYLASTDRKPKDAIEYFRKALRVESIERRRGYRTRAPVDSGR